MQQQAAPSGAGASGPPDLSHYEIAFLGGLPVAYRPSGFAVDLYLVEPGGPLHVSRLIGIAGGTVALYDAFSLTQDQTRFLGIQAGIGDGTTDGAPVWQVYRLGDREYVQDPARTAALAGITDRETAMEVVRNGPQSPPAPSSVPR